MSAFEPVSTLADLDSLDENEIVAGYLDYSPDDPEPGPNRGRAYWHGWMNRARDQKRAEPTYESARLVAEWMEAGR